jgi:MFS transporter, FHS family, L-fucose permease
MPPPGSKPGFEDEPRLFPAGAALPFVLVTVLFFLWAIPHNLNDILIKQFMKSFQLTRLRAGLIQSAFYIGYFLLSMPAALIMRRYGYKVGLVTGLFLFSAGALLFWPAAILQEFHFFLFALFVIASGLAFLETGSNSFVAMLGDPRTSERRLNFSQSFNPLGAISGALIGTVFILSGVELSPAEIAARKLAGTYQAYLRGETLRVVRPYMVLASVVLVWALLLIRTKFPKVAEEALPQAERRHGRLGDLFRFPHFVQGVVAQFLYVGAQVGTWSFFIQYIQDYTGSPEKTAGFFLTGSLVAFGIGRFIATYLMKFFNPSRLMGIYSIINCALVALAVVRPGWVGVWAVFFTSFFMSLMFPTIFALGIKELGANTKLGGSMQIMAIVGGAAAPPAMGYIYQLAHSMALSMLVPGVCYAFIVYYSYAGCRVRVPADVAA